MSINLKTTVSVQQERNVTIESPAFYKQGHYFRAVIEESFINIFQIEGMRTWMSHDSVESSKREIIEAYDSWEHISEEEFFEALNKALTDFNFKIGYKETALQADAEMERRSAQW